MKEIPKTVIRRDGDEIIVSLPDGTIVPANSVEHAKRIANRWLAPTGEIGVGVRYHQIEWLGFDSPPE